MKKYLYTIFIGLLMLISLGSSNASKLSLDPETWQKIDDYVQNVYRKENSNTSVTLSITNNEAVLYSAGYGYMDVENEIETTNKTDYLIGSISKSFAAIIVVKTLHEKFPDLDIETALNTPIRKLAPQINFTLNDRFRSEQTTFRDMLSHRVCSLPDGIATLTVPFDSDHEVAYRQRYAPEGCPFRAGFVYNNGMYTLVASTIEAIAGESYANLLTGLFQDIGMLETTFVKKDDADVPPNRAIPYYVRNGERHRYNPGLMRRVAIATAAGGIVSNALDMAKYARFFLNKGKLGDRQVVPPNVIESMFKMASIPPLPQTYKPEAYELTFAYALGLFVGHTDGWQRIGHGGSVPPFQTELTFYPGLNLGIYTASNQMPLKMTHAQLHSGIFYILLGENPKMFSSESKNEGIRKTRRGKPVKLTEKQQNDLLGSYGNGLQGEMDILMRYRNETGSAELYMSYGQWGKAYLVEPDENLKFRVVWDSDIIQDEYSMGVETNCFVVFKENGTVLEYVENDLSAGTFKKGVYLGNLPPVPWSPGSCGPS